MVSAYSSGMSTLTFTEKTPRNIVVDADFNYEANWFYNITTIPGTYRALCTTLNGKPCSLEDAYWVFVSIDAICTGGYVPGYKGANDADQKIGQPMPRNFQCHAYMVRESLMNDESPYTVHETVTCADE